MRFETMNFGAKPEVPKQEHNSLEKQNLPFDYDEKSCPRHLQKTLELLNNEDLKWNDVSFELPRLKVLLGEKKFSELNIDENKLFDSFSESLEERKTAGEEAFLYALAGIKQISPNNFSESNLIDKAFNEQGWQKLKALIEKYIQKKDWGSLVGTLHDLKIVSEEKFNELSSVVSDQDWSDIVKEVEIIKQNADNYDDFIEEHSALIKQGYDLNTKPQIGMWQILTSYCAQLKSIAPERFNPSYHIDRKTWSTKIAKQYGQQYHQEEEIMPHLTGWASLDMAKDMKIISEAM